MPGTCDINLLMLCLCLSSAGESDIFAYLNQELRRRIMVIDGAMGTMIQVRFQGARARTSSRRARATSLMRPPPLTSNPLQRHKFEEVHYRGKRFESYHRDIKGNNDILVLTQPDAIRAIHM